MQRVQERSTYVAVFHSKCCKMLVYYNCKVYCILIFLNVVKPSSNVHEYYTQLYILEYTSYTQFEFEFTEFLPYVFQLLSLMMELTPPGAIAEPYLQLLPCLLAPTLWERHANCSPLVRLLCAYITQAASQISSQEKLVMYKINIVLKNRHFNNKHRIRSSSRF